MSSQEMTAFRVTIGRTADIKGLIRETPASLILHTPSVSVQIQVMRTEIDDNRLLRSG